MQRTRLLILVALLVVVIGIVAAFLLVGGDEEEGPAPGPTSPVAVGGDPNDEEPADAVDPGLPTLTPLPTQELTTIIIAFQPLSRGQEIVQGTIDFAPWPVEALPPNAYVALGSTGDDLNPGTALEDLYGQRVRTDIAQGQPLMSTDVVPSAADLAAIGSDLAAIIPEGEVAIAVPIDRLTSVAYGIQSGDRVDISISLLYVDIDEQYQSILPNTVTTVTFNAESGQPIFGQEIPGRFEEQRVDVRPEIPGLEDGFLDVVISPSEDPRPRLVVQRTVQDAQILYVGNIPSSGRIFGITPTPAMVNVPEEDGEDTEVTVQEQGGNLSVGADGVEIVIRPDIVVVSVTPQEALVMTWLIEAGVPLNFLLRSAADNSRVLTQAVTLEYIMDSYEITLPEPRNFSIEPAIRSIRSVILTNVQPIDSGNVTLQGQQQTGGGGGNAGGN